MGNIVGIKRNPREANEQSKKQKGKTQQANHWTHLACFVIASHALTPTPI
jgi:hypothetical protein